MLTPRIRRRVGTLPIGAALALLAATSPLAAQSYTLSFDPDQGSGAGDNTTQLDPAYGTVPGRVTVASQAHTAFGNNPATRNPMLCYWNGDYGDLTGVGYTCSASAGVGEFAIRPAPGFAVFLESLEVGEYLGRVPGEATVKVFSWDYATELFSASLALGAAGHWNVAFSGLSSTEGLRLQYGDDWDYGADDITFRVERITTATPEPASMALLSTGLLGLGAARRSRRKHGDATR